MQVKILIIEDDLQTSEALRKAFEREGFQSETRASGEDGLHLLTTERFDFMFLDWMLPGRDGVEMLKFLRARGNKTPVETNAGVESGGIATTFPGRTGVAAHQFAASVGATSLRERWKRVGDST